jgi:uncharacterized surface protein with fasciclin (FAS1) repeats
VQLIYYAYFNKIPNAAKLAFLLLIIYALLSMPFTLINFKTVLIMKVKGLLVIFFALIFNFFSASAQTGDVFEVIVSSPDHSKFVKSLNASSLVNTLKTGGQLTVFAPTNEAFGKISKGRLDSLLKPEMKDVLSGIVGYHVVTGKFDAATLINNMKHGGGETQLLTISGKKLLVVQEGDKIKISDGANMVATITTADIKGTNGIVHVIDAVVVPK